MGWIRALLLGLDLSLAIPEQKQVKKQSKEPEQDSHPPVLLTLLAQL